MWSQGIYNGLMEAQRKRWRIIEDFVKKERITDLPMGEIIKDKELLNQLKKLATSDEKVLKAINGQLDNISEINIIKKVDAIAKCLKKLK